MSPKQSTISIITLYFIIAMSLKGGTFDIFGHQIQTSCQELPLGEEAI